MKRIVFENVRTDGYDIIIEPGLLPDIGQRIRDLEGAYQQVVVITDKSVENLYASTVLNSLSSAGFSTDLLTVEPGERSKSLAGAQDLWGRLVEKGFRRRSLLMALGGGVITDMTGFVAATFMRGVAYINVPTTLIAQLDAAVGSKVAVNHEKAKNLIGSFYHPAAVYADTTVLSTLPVSEIRHGLSEAIKVSIVQSPELFDMIEAHAEALLDCDIDRLAEVVALAVDAKVELLRPDLYENDLRRTLNFGHTTGHALETVLGYEKISHGAAISIGMAAATRLAVARGLCDLGTGRRMIALLQRVGLPTVATEGTPAEIWEALSVVRTIRNGNFHEVLPTGIGSSVFFEGLSEEVVGRFMYNEDMP